MPDNGFGPGNGRAAFYLVAGVLAVIVLVAGVLVFHRTPDNRIDQAAQYKAPVTAPPK